MPTERRRAAMAAHGRWFKETMMERHTPCGCNSKVIVFAHDETIRDTSTVINFCPLHAAAPDLLAACKIALEHSQELMRLWDLELPKDTAAVLEAAIAKATGTN